MSGVIINPHKLERLPKSLQEAIQSLNSSQLSTLQAAFSNFTHFNFLGLPLEIRLMIYHLLLDTPGNNIRWGKRQPHQNLALLRVNKQVSFEAWMVFKETKTCQLIWMSSKHRMYPKQALPLRKLRHFDVLIRPNNLEFEAEDFQDSLWTLSKKMASELQAGHYDSDRHAQMSLHLQFGHEEILAVTTEPRLDTFDPSQKFSLPPSSMSVTDKYRVLFVKTQLEDMVRDLRETLSDFSNLVLTSNVESVWPNVEALRARSNLVNFKDKVGRRMGSISGAEWDSLTCNYITYYDAAVLSRFGRIGSGLPR